MIASTHIDKEAVEKVYARWAPVYDLVFGAVFERGRRAVVAAGERIGGRILEVGVGTGLALPYYSNEHRVFGIDLSEEMLGQGPGTGRPGGAPPRGGSRDHGRRAVGFRR